MIGSLSEVENFLQTPRPNTYVISIRNSDRRYQKEYVNLDRIKENCAGMFLVFFDDVWKTEHVRYGYSPASFSAISNMLKFSEDKRELYVHCSSGISRAPAVAYVLMCAKTSPQKAITSFNIHRHFLNPWIVEIGSVFLKNKYIQIEANKYAQKQKEKGGMILDMDDHPTIGMEFLQKREKEK